MLSLYIHADDEFIEFNSEEELTQYVIERFNSDLTHIKIFHEYENIYAVYDTDTDEYF